MTLDAATEADDTSADLDVNAALDQAEADPIEDEADETEEAPKPAAKGAPVPKAEAKPKAVAPAVEDLSDLLAEGVKFTPETLQKGAARVVAQAKAAQELTSKAHKLWGTAEKHARKTERREGQSLEVQRTLNSQVQLFNASMNAIKSGDAKTALEGLRQLRGGDPVAFLEELNIHIATNGKKKAKAPELLEMEARLERFEQAERDRETRAEEQRALAFIAQREQELTALATEGEEDYPLVAEFAEENPETIGKALSEIIIHHARKGRKVADSDAVRMLEKQLQAQSELSERARTKREKRTADSGSERGTGNPSNPGAANTPKVKGKSLSVSAVTTPTVNRDLTEEELAEDSASFLPPALLNWARGSSM